MSTKSGNRKYSFYFADAYRIASGPVGHENFGFLKPFPGMGGANRNAFTITMEARLVSKGECRCD